MLRRPALLIPILLTPLALPAAPASAATWTVDAGVPLASHAAIWARGADANAYFPNRLSIRVGDTIRFRPSGYHSVHLGRRGGRPDRTLVASKERVAGERDAAGQPFWFNGQRAFDNVGAVSRSRFGRSLTFTGATQLRSGFRTKGPRRALSVRFTRTGTFRFVCDYHVGMKGTVKVVPRRRSVRSPAQVAAGVRRTMARYLKAAGTLTRTLPPAQVIDVGRAGARGLEFYDFVPKLLSIPVGGTVRFRSSPGSLETHSVATGPGSARPVRATYIGQISRTFQQVRASPLAIYPSEAPGTPSVLTPGLHGNGFWSSGMLDRTAATSFPATRELTFPTAGTYVFACLIHRYMRTAVKVG